MIYFDNIIFSLQKSGGISVVWSEVLKGVLNSTFNYICLEYNGATDNIFRKNLNIPPPNINSHKYRLLPIQRYINPRIQNNQNHVFIFHSSYYRYSNHKDAINFTTVHDFTYEYYSRGLKKILHCWQKYKAIKKSDYIICISETTKKDLFKFIPTIDKKKVFVIYNGVSDEYHTIPYENRIKYEFSNDFIVFVGARGGYKNFNLAVSAIKRTKLNLIIVGNELSEKENDLLISELGANRFKFLGRVSNEELNQIYNQAYCLLYPSSYEGFGIPVIEAQRAGCPVVTVDAPSILEIIGDKTLVASKDVNSIVEKINSLQDTSLREYIINKGLENSTKYSWDKMRLELLNLYNQALEDNQK